MSRVFVTGDTHQSIDISKLNMKNFPEQNNINRRLWKRARGIIL